MLNKEAGERWVKLLASAISTAQPTSTEQGNNSHYVMSREAFDALIAVHGEIAKELWGSTAAQPSGAREAAREIASHLFATIFHPSGNGGISESQEAEIAAIISRYFPPPVLTEEAETENPV